LERDEGFGVREMTASPVEADVLFHRPLLAASGNELLRRMEMVLERAAEEVARL
jgi:DNA-binding FadR family transcriptional regulator